MNPQPKTEGPIGVEQNGVEPHQEEIKDSQSPHSLNSIEINEVVANIGELTNVADIEALQRKLHLDYKALAKEFSSKRISRVEAFTKKINDVQAQLKKDFRAHEAIVQNNLPTIDEETSVSIPSLKQTQAEKRRRFEQQATFSSSDLHTFPSSPEPQPPVSPTLRELPIFSASFAQVLKPYKDNLKSLRSKYDYESRLIEQSAVRDVELIWRQSAKDRIEARQSLRQKYILERHKLELDYNNVIKYAKISNSEKRYRASVKKVGEKRLKADLSHITKLVQKRNQNSPKIITNPQSLPSATHEEILNDLLLIENASPENLQIEKYEANYKYMEQPLRKSPTYAKPTMTDIVNSQLEGGANPSVMPSEFQAPSQVYDSIQSPFLYGAQPHYQMPPPQNLQLYPHPMSQQQQQMYYQQQQKLNWGKEQEKLQRNSSEVRRYTEDSSNRDETFQFALYTTSSPNNGPPKGTFKN